MKKVLIILTVTITVFLFSGQQTNGEDSINKSNLTGKWITMGPMGTKSLTFKENGLIEYNFGDDNNVELVTEYKIIQDTIIFNDKEGFTCPNTGKYKLFVNEYYIAFDLIEDNCGGRIKNTMGFWVRPNYEELLEELSYKISQTGKPEYYLKRARMYIALGQSQKAKSDLDYYVENGQVNARVYINRAGTQMPDHPEGVISDCDKAINLDEKNKNAFFLKGLALYSLDKKEEACQNFTKAIDLGFSILRIAEKQRCAEFWEPENTN